ncbi:MAG: dihydrofolate reductase [Flavitalea sp.]
MIINLVVAAAANNVIGKNNQLLWNLPNDMLFFKNVTWGMPVIMGRKSYESLGKPLKGRTNIVVSRRKDLVIGGATVVTSLDEAYVAAALEDVKQCHVIGGGEIYREAMPIATRIFMTRVHALLDGDTLFPTIDQVMWKRVSYDDHTKDARHAYDYTFEVWERNS